jgi:penicillin-binding protein 2
LETDGNPLANRALNYSYPPGSTFKMITSLAAIRAGVSPSYTVNGTGSYSFSDLTLHCWIWTQNGYGHGLLDMRGAIANSCNIYFYTVGLLAGIDRIDEVATSFGIGEDPGTEIPSNNGQIASPALKKELYGEDRGWYDADTATASIGQSDTEVTPLQLCRYVATLANGGTLYKATFLRRAVSSDFQTLVAANDYTPVATDLMSESEYQVIYEGMRQCVTEGTASKLADYDVAVCAKTGTAQHGNGGSDNGAFVCWAPAEDPEIAIAIYVEHGASGSNFAEVAQDILDYYFSSKNSAQELELENEMTED